MLNQIYLQALSFHDTYGRTDECIHAAADMAVELGIAGIDIEDRLLTLKGERKYENEVKEDSYYRRERSYGKFQRAFRLPADVDPDIVKAKFKDGVLEIEVPKPEEQKPKQITIH